MKRRGLLIFCLGCLPRNTQHTLTICARGFSTLFQIPPRRYLFFSSDWLFDLALKRVRVRAVVVRVRVRAVVVRVRVRVVIIFFFSTNLE